MAGTFTPPGTLPVILSPTTTGPKQFTWGAARQYVDEVTGLVIFKAGIYVKIGGVIKFREIEASGTDLLNACITGAGAMINWIA
jgi:hypothetical protein